MPIYNDLIFKIPFFRINLNTIFAFYNMVFMTTLSLSTLIMPMGMR
jgi:hypothetical protein